MSDDLDESASTDVASTDVEMDTVLQCPGANILSETGEASGQASPKQHVGGRDAILSSQGQTSKNSSRLSAGDCNLLLNPPVNTAYELWLQKRSRLFIHRNYPLESFDIGGCTRHSWVPY